MRLVKTHGSLNEIFALEAAPGAWESEEDLQAFVRHVCDRGAWTGGSDGIYLFDAAGANAQAWFFNPDGSPAEFCGNGMRGLGRLILDRRGTDTEVIASGGRDYAVHRAPSTPEGVRQVLLDLPPLRFGDAALPAPFAGFTAVAVPNPHVIAIVTEYSEAALIELGRRADEVFAQGANVSFLLPLDVPRASGPGQAAVPEVFVRTFERGAGLTPSCGSGVVASRAAYSLATGLDPGRRVVVRNAGGVAAASVHVRDNDWYPVLEGNATVVYAAEVARDGSQLGAVEFASAENDAYAVLDRSNSEYLAARAIRTADSWRHGVSASA
jgi:diaminopimelate epimerase